jgi:hypothetical protein
LVKFCYVPATSADLPRAFLLWPLTVLARQRRQAVHAIKQSIFLDVYGIDKERERKHALPEHYLHWII